MKAPAAGREVLRVPGAVARRPGKIALTLGTLAVYRGVKDREAHRGLCDGAKRVL